MLSPLTLLLASIDEGFDRVAWHGPTLLGSLRGVTARQAAWRPFPHRHNIWEVTVHAAYWKYTYRRRLTGEKRGSFEPEGSRTGSCGLTASWGATRSGLERGRQALMISTVSSAPRSRIFR
jgi:hypothetical protein